MALDFFCTYKVFCSILFVMILYFFSVIRLFVRSFAHLLRLIIWLLARLFVRLFVDHVRLVYSIYFIVVLLASPAFLFWFRLNFSFDSFCLGLFNYQSVIKNSSLHCGLYTDYWLVKSPGWRGYIHSSWTIEWNNLLVRGIFVSFVVVRTESCNDHFLPCPLSKSVITYSASQVKINIKTLIFVIPYF